MHSVPEDSPAASLPTQGTRTAVSFLLFLHLFALLVAVASNARPVSPLRNQLRAVPAIAPYLQLLHMDLAYNYHLTFGTEFDTDHFIELELHRGNSDSPAQGERLVFPASDAGSDLRAQRYRNLTLTAANLIGNDEFGGLIPRAIARRLLVEHSIDEGTHRVRLRRHLLQPPEAVDSPDPQRSDPYDDSYYANAYEADVRFFDGELFLTGVASTGETAPVESLE